MGGDVQGGGRQVEGGPGCKTAMNKKRGFDLAVKFENHCIRGHLVAKEG